MPHRSKIVILAAFLEGILGRAEAPVIFEPTDQSLKQYVVLGVPNGVVAIRLPTSSATKIVDVSLLG